MSEPTTSFAKSLLAVGGMPLFGWGMALFSQLAFSFATPMAKAIILLGVVPTNMLLIRLVMATVLLGITLMATAPDKFRMDRRGRLMCGLIGLVNSAGMLGYFWSLNWLEASVAVMIYALSPVALLCLLALFGEKFTYRNTIRVALGLAGVYLLVGPSGQSSLLGIVLALTAVISVPLQLFLMQRYLREYDTRAVTFYLSVVMLIVVGVAWLAQRPEWHDPGWMGWGLLFVLSVISTYLARLSQTGAVAQIGAGQVGLLAPLETFLAVIWSVLFLSEHLNLLQVLGGSLILLSAILASQRMLRVRWPPQPDF